MTLGPFMKPVTLTTMKCLSHEVWQLVSNSVQHLKIRMVPFCYRWQRIVKELKT